MQLIFFEKKRAITFAPHLVCNFLLHFCIYFLLSQVLMTRLLEPHSCCNVCNEHKKHAPLWICGYIYDYLHTFYDQLSASYQKLYVGLICHSILKPIIITEVARYNGTQNCRIPQLSDASVTLNSEIHKAAILALLVLVNWKKWRRGDL